MDSHPLISCQCGTISLRAPRPKPIAVYACHCLECRKQSSSAFGISAMFPSEGIWPLPEHLQPHIGVWKRLTDTGNTLECYFCKTCGVRVIHRSILPDGNPKPALAVKGGCLEGLSLEGAKHIFVRTALVPVPEGSDQAFPDLTPGMKVD